MNNMPTLFQAKAITVMSFVLTAEELEDRNTKVKKVNVFSDSHHKSNKNRKT